MGAVKNAVQRDGKDPNMMDLDPNKSIKSQTGGVDDDKDDDYCSLQWCEVFQ